LVFDRNTQVQLQQLASSASFEFRLGQRVTLSAALGGTFAGSLGPPDNVSSVALGPGIVGSVAGSVVLLPQGERWPFILLSGSLGSSWISRVDWRQEEAGYQRKTYLGFDLRAGLSVGYTFFERLTPYLTARAFGGPVFYGQSVGTDLYHYQLGLGLVMRLPAGFDLAAEVVPLGEQRLSFSAGMSF
jgi:hypothetical protein